MNPFLATDGYKTGHHLMYPEGTTLVYSNFTPRSNKYAPKGCDKVISFGQQMVMQQIKDSFDKYFFFTNDRSLLARSMRINGKSALDLKKEEVCGEIKREYSQYLGTDYDVSHIEALWDLGYLPIHVKSLPEGTAVPMGVPVLTIYNTLPEFYWLTNFLETLISNLLWKPMTSATIANQYKKNLLKWAEKTDKKNIGFVEFQGHDFSMRGMDSLDATVSSGLGHATSFLGSDSLPVIHGARTYYGETGPVIHSVNATEHSVMCAGSKEDEIGTFRYLMDKFPTGILSVVSDTWDLWKVLTEYLPKLKEEILSRDGKLVIRPDSGDPIDIICGKASAHHFIKNDDDFNDFIVNIREYQDKIIIWKDKWYLVGNVEEYEDEYGKGDIYDNWNKDNFNELLYGNKIGILTEQVFDLNQPEQKGVIELLWDLFGGTVNEQGYKVLDPHIGAIYGDSITIDRAEDICKRLEAKGFASTNVVLGIGSFTYQFNTRDTFGFAMKATYVELWDKGFGQITQGGRAPEIVGREIFKDPITDDGSKKSAKGLLKVFENVTHNMEHISYELIDQVEWKHEKTGSLKTIFKDGEFFNKTTLTEIREKVKNL